MQSYTLLMLGGILAVGCSDAITQSPQRSPDLDVTIPGWLSSSEHVAGDSAGAALMMGEPNYEALPAEFQQETSIDLEVVAGVWPGFMRGEAIVRYWGTDAEVDLELKLLKGYSEMGSKGQRTAQSNWWPESRQISARSEYELEPTCDYGIQAVGIASVWNHALLKFSFLQWGRKTVSDDDTARQPTCGSAGGAGGGGGDTGTTLTLEVCYYTAETFGKLVIIHEHGCYKYNLGEYAT